MSKRMRIRSFLMILSLISIALWLLADNLFAQRPDNRATTQLAVLSEDFSADDIEKINSLILANADVNVRNKYGGTPLFMASEKGHTEIVILLLAANADFDAVRTTDGVTPLHMASQNGHAEVVKLLLAANADVDAASTTGGYSGYTPLFMASQNGYTEIVILLLAANADVDAASTRDGYTALWVASQTGHTEIIRLLQEAGATIK